MSEYTPTTDQVCSQYAADSRHDVMVKGEAEFDRWLATVKAEALEIAAVRCPERLAALGMADWLRHEAARIRNDAGIGGGA